MTMPTDNPFPAGILNTDRELWSDGNARLFVTETDGIGMEVSGNVIVRPLRDWHSLVWHSLAAPSSLEHDAIEALRECTTRLQMEADEVKYLLETYVSESVVAEWAVQTEAANEATAEVLTRARAVLRRVKEKRG
jgi:hypothetical protein